jgi:DNA-binding YbaB/EbfC family protein
MSGYKGGFGGMGGGNMQNLMKQAQKMQEQMQQAQQELEEAEIVGSTSQDAVVVYMNGKKLINSIEIDPDAVDKEDIEMLEDLIIAAINDGYAKADALEKEKMGPFAALGNMGGLL